MNVIKEGGASRFQEGFIVPKEGTNPDVQREMSRYFRGEIPITQLPPAVHDWAKAITKLWDERGKAMVDAGLMSWETYAARRSAPNSYFPHLYVTNELNNTGIRWAFHKLKMVLDRLKPQLSTAFYIAERHPVTMQMLTDAKGNPRLLNHSDNTWRFNSAQHRDEWFAGYVRQEVVKRVRRHAIDFTLEDLDALELQSDETAALVASVEQDIRSRWMMGSPKSLEQLEQAGLITNLAYVVPKSLAQMDHDIFLARLFKKIADEPQFVADAPLAGFTEIPNDNRFGKLAGRFVQENIAQEILELQQAPELAWQVYDAALAEWKKWKTVYNPATHVRNVLGNFFFADLAGVGVQNLTNAPYYFHAFRALKGESKEHPLRDLYSYGLLGGDFASAELQGLLKLVKFDPKETNLAKWLVKFPYHLAKRAGKKARDWYELEDAVFKTAAFIKARESGMGIEQAVDHVRKWFPYYDQVGASTTIRYVKRLSSPFLSFMQEALRIGGLAAMEKPITFAKWLAIPTLISAIARHALHLDDEEWERIQQGMKGTIGDTAVFAALLPIPLEDGKLAQMDFSNVIPYADMLGQRMGTADNEPIITAMAQKYFLSGPPAQIIIAGFMGFDPFTMTKFRKTDMTGMEDLGARAKYVAKQILPPLTPLVGSSDLITTFTKPEIEGRYLRQRSKPMEVSRKLFGIDVRPADPDLYKSVENFRKEQGLPSVPEFNDSTARSRARAAVYSALVNNDVDRLAESLVELRQRTGDSVRSVQDVNKLFFHRNPAYGISGQAERRKWMDSLTRVEKRTLDRAVTDFEKAKRNAVTLIRQAEAKRPELTAPRRKPLIVP